MSEPEPHNPVESSYEGSSGVTEKDIRAVVPEINGTVLVLQVNAKDTRNVEANSPEFGALKPEVQAAVSEKAKKFLEETLAGLGPNEKDSVDVIVFASDAPLRMPGGIENPHQRAYETAENVLKGFKDAMDSSSLDATTHLLNLSNEYAEAGGKPIPVPGWVDLKMWEEPEFVEKLQNILGHGREFWEKYETDWREQAGEMPSKVELPNQIASRTREVLSEMIIYFANRYHNEHPGKRLIIWVDGMYDNISPWIKSDVLGKNPAESYLPNEKGGGITIEIAADGKTTKTQIAGREYSVDKIIRQFITSDITQAEIDDYGKSKK